MKKRIIGVTVLLLLVAIPQWALAGTYPLLKHGSSGEAVVKLQTALQAEGCFDYHTATGYYGQITTDAVASFQRAKGLTVDGLAGSKTQTALYEAASRQMLKMGMSGSDVTAMQQKLKEFGYFFGTCTGYFGTITLGAVKDFQHAYGLTTDGIAGPKTLAALNQIGGATATSRGGVDRDSLYWLARIVEAEAGGEAREGKIAVANVVLNRVESKSFPNTVYDVIFEYYKGIPQFSPVAEGTIYNTPSSASLSAVEAAAAGTNNVGEALYFFNPEKANAGWIVNTRQYICTIGGHAFYL